MTSRLAIKKRHPHTRNVSSNNDMNLPDADSPERAAQRQRLDTVPNPSANEVPQFAPIPFAIRRALAPPVLSAVPASHPIDPPHVNLLAGKYTTHTMSVSKNCKIHAKVSQLLNAIAQHDVVVISAREDAGCKLISVVEIAKRRLEADGVPFCQYTGVVGRLEQLKTPRKSGGDDDGMIARYGLGRRVSDGALEGGLDVARAGAEAGVKDEDEDMGDVEEPEEAKEPEDAFQQMEVPQRVQVRQIPIMHVFLSKGPVPELRVFYGMEQTSMMA